MIRYLTIVFSTHTRKVLPRFAERHLRHFAVANQHILKQKLAITTSTLSTLVASQAWRLVCKRQVQPIMVCAVCSVSLSFSTQRCRRVPVVFLWVATTNCWWFMVDDVLLILTSSQVSPTTKLWIGCFLTVALVVINWVRPALVSTALTTHQFLFWDRRALIGQGVVSRLGNIEVKTTPSFRNAQTQILCWQNLTSCLTHFYSVFQLLLGSQGHKLFSAFVDDNARVHMTVFWKITYVFLQMCRSSWLIYF